jgi:hypothetical protein
MPLKRTTNTRNSDSDRSAIGFWMEVEGAPPVRPVRVFVTYEALANLDPSQVRDLEGALKTFDNNRPHIDRSASSKFDGGDTEEELYEGQPTLVLRTHDLT